MKNQTVGQPRDLLRSESDLSKEEEDVSERDEIDKQMYLLLFFNDLFG